MKHDPLMAAAAAADAAAATAQPEPAIEQVNEPPVDDLRPIVAPAVGLVAAAACRRYGVTPLEQRERDALADALCRVAEAYDLRVADPKIAAWLALAATAGAIMANRKPVVVAPEPANETDPPPLYPDAA